MLIWLNCLFYPTLYPSYVHVCQQCIVREGGVRVMVWIREQRYSHTMETVVQAKQLLWLTVGQV